MIVFYHLYYKLITAVHLFSFIQCYCNYITEWSKCHSTFSQHHYFWHHAVKILFETGVLIHPTNRGCLTALFCRLLGEQSQTGVKWLSSRPFHWQSSAFIPGRPFTKPPLRHFVLARSDLQVWTWIIVMEPWWDPHSSGSGSTARRKAAIARKDEGKLGTHAFCFLAEPSQYIKDREGACWQSSAIVPQSSAEFDSNHKLRWGCSSEKVLIIFCFVCLKLFAYLYCTTY